MRYPYLFLVLWLCIGCKINKTVNHEPHGLWIEKTKIGDKTYKSRGRYKNGFEQKTWRYYENGKLVKKEVYKDSVCHVTHFKNRKKILEGQTRIRVSDSLLHWFYAGDWTEYDALGRISAVRTYKDGELVDEKEISAN